MGSEMCIRDRGSKIRSRVLLLEEGEKATRFFFGLERKRASQNLVSSIYDESGVEVFRAKRLNVLM